MTLSRQRLLLLSDGDKVLKGEVRLGFANINDNAEIAEMIACGAHVILFVTGRILAGARLDDVTDEIHDPVRDVSAGAPTRSEALGPRPCRIHPDLQEFRSARTGLLTAAIRRPRSSNPGSQEEKRCDS